MFEQMRPLNNHGNNISSWLLLLVVACFCIWYFGTGTDTNSSHISNRIDATSTNIREAEKTARSARSELERAESFARSAEERITTSIRYNSELTESVTDSAKLITECRKLANEGESIVRSVILRNQNRTREAGAGTD